MAVSLQKIFETHPRDCGESYFEHQRAAFTYARVLFAAAAAALVHGLVPCFFETTASRAVARMHAFGQARAAGMHIRLGE